MLNSILIKNIVLIDRLEIKLFNNFSVLTGETGSGKSILLDALGLAIGYRSNNRLLRKGSSQGLVAAEFEIENNQECKEILLENGLINPDNPNILILRRILLEGSSKAFVNDVAVGVNLLAKIGATLIEIHGQHEQSNLLETSFHRKILDQYASNKELLAKVNKIFDDLDNTKKELQKLHDQAANNEREKDYLIHIIKELEEAHLEENEEEILTNKRNVILSSEKISNLMSEVLSEVSEADSQIFCANRSLIRNQSLGNFIDEEENKLEILTNILDEISIKNDQAKSLIDQIMSNIGGGNESLEDIEERLFLLRNLSRKFNITIDQLPNFLDEAESKLAIVDNFTILAEDLKKKKTILEKEYLSQAENLSEIRQKAGLKLTNKVQDELKFLKMPSVKFAVKIDKLNPNNYSRNGIDNIKFSSATNASSNLDDISKIASGGELSRFMLALKVALLEIKSTPVLIFDEIDSGIGGAVANAVGDRLKLLSGNSQILVVTHHPQIAAKANNHLRVEKSTNNNITKTQITILDLEAKEREVARMLSAEQITDESMAAARKLMEQ
ncbi:MAG: DNA repair protein RecN (Recombination protein N) [Rickettsiales bacterium]